MWQIAIGSLLLSLIHASIPNHWLPLLAIGKAEKWTLKESLSATVVTGFAHTLSTILIGIIVGFIGIQLSNAYSVVMTFIAPSILIGIGAVYVIIDLTNHHHHHHHHEIENMNTPGRTKSKLALLFSLSLAMFLTPCVEIEAYYFQAGLIGWKGIFMVSAVYTFTTVMLMLLLVFIGYKGTQKIRTHTLEHHEKLITGSVLVALGILGFLVRF